MEGVEQKEQIKGSVNGLLRGVTNRGASGECARPKEKNWMLNQSSRERPTMFLLATFIFEHYQSIHNVSPNITQVTKLPLSKA